MKKSQLRSIIRETIKQIGEEKQMLNEVEGCHFSFPNGDCGPSHCTTYSSGNAGEICACRSFVPGSDDCDESDTGSYVGGSVKTKIQPMGEIKGMGREPILPSTDAAEEWCTCRYYRCKKDTTKTNSTISWGGCTGSGACGCMSGYKTGGRPLAPSTKF